MGREHGDGRARDSRPDAVGAAREDDRHARAEHDPGAVGVGEKREQLGEDVARFEIGDEQDVGIAGDGRTDALDRCRVLVDRVVERQRTIDQRACDLSAVGHLAQRGRVDRRRHLRVDGFHGGENRDLRRGDAKGNREIDGVLADIDFVLERRGNVDGRVGHDEDLVVGRHVHDEDVTDAAARPKPSLPRHHGAQQLVGVQAPLHEQLGLTQAHELHGLGRRCVAVRRVDQADLTELDSVLLRDVADLLRRTDEDGRDQALRAGFDGAGQRRRVARVCDGRGHRVQAATPRQQLFVLSRSCFSSHVASCAAAGSGDASAAGPVSLRRNVRMIASATPYSSGSNAVW